MRTAKITLAAFTASVLLQGCAATPMGPTVQVLPQPGKPLAVYQQEQVTCNQYATASVRGAVDSANMGAGLAVLGGAAGGAAIGSDIRTGGGSGHGGAHGGRGDTRTTAAHAHGHAAPRTASAHGGSHGGHGGGGNAAAAGAAIGAVAGLLAGAAASQQANNGIHWRYDRAYAMCMVSKGNGVPMYASYVQDPDDE